MISVIVNVYNGEKYIKQCVKSILSQTFKDFELIIINDGSTDQTSSILKTISETDNRIKYYETPNQGLSKSRQYGLTKVNGEYLIFVDCDDIVENDYLKELYNALINENADLAICDYVEIYSTKKKYISVESHESTIEYTKDLMHLKTWSVVWNKLVKVSLIKDNNIIFIDHIRYWEDVPFSISYSLYCSKIAYVNQPLYFYNRTNLNSLTSSENINNKLDRVKAVRYIEQHILKSGLYKNLKQELFELKFHITKTFLCRKMSNEYKYHFLNSFPEIFNVCLFRKHPVYYIFIRLNLIKLLTIDKYFLYYKQLSKEYIKRKIQYRKVSNS